MQISLKLGTIRKLPYKVEIKRRTSDAEALLEALFLLEEKKKSRNACECIFRIRIVVCVPRSKVVVRIL